MKAESTLLRSLSYGRVHEVINSCVVAESTGVEPVRDCSHWFSKPAHYRPAHSPQEDKMHAHCTIIKM